MFSWQEQYLTSERSELVRHCSCHSNTPGGGALANFAWPRVWAFANPGATFRLLVHTKKILIAAVYFHFVDPL